MLSQVSARRTNPEAMHGIQPPNASSTQNSLRQRAPSACSDPPADADQEGSFPTSTAGRRQRRRVGGGDSLLRLDPAQSSYAATATAGGAGAGTGTGGGHLGDTGSPT